MYAISIHALRVEGDVSDAKSVAAPVYISIHALRVEGDKQRRRILTAFFHFYPRPPGGGRRLANCWDWINKFEISIHALRVEGDVKMG